MNIKILLVFVVVVGVVVGITIFFREEAKAPDSTGDSSGLI